MKSKICFISQNARMIRLILVIVGCLGFITTSYSAAAEEPNFRRPQDEENLRYWLQNMIWYHHFSADEVRAATGLSAKELSDAVTRLRISREGRPKREDQDPLLVLAYPGGRHPRIGFLDGAIRPQRESKISVFTPWDEESYVVVDVPEAVWSNLGLTYLAHTHVDTVWTKKGIDMDPLEWNRLSEGKLEIERKLPNGIRFGAKITPRADSVLMDLWLYNGTSETLTDLRVQNCVMLKGAEDLNQLSNDNKMLSNPYVACRSSDGRRWVITAWDPCHRPWVNPPVPCMHSDPKFQDCAPGETKSLKGWLSFYEGVDIIGEFERIDATGWRANNP